MKQDLTKAENRLKEFREKNRQVLSPQLLLEQERLIRDVQINATIYTERRKQFELVKIEEVKNILGWDPVVKRENGLEKTIEFFEFQRTII